jgi:hypothetical protein
MRAPDGYFYIYAPHPDGLYQRVVSRRHLEDFGGL